MILNNIPKLIYILFALIYSQVCYLGVFWEENLTDYVVQEDENLCGVFTRWDATQPNWLPEYWKSATLSQKNPLTFTHLRSCKDGEVASCCRQAGYKYAGVPIGQSDISEERKAAEFLAGKKYINTQSLDPSSYKLHESITRKEVMKIIMQISQKPIKQECREVFADVIVDWWCKYIESGFDYGFINDNEFFRPNDSLNHAEAIKLIFQARDISKRYSTHSWQQDYISSAYYLSYIDEKFADFTTPIPRGMFFQIVARTYPEFSNY